MKNIRYIFNNDGSIGEVAPERGADLVASDWPVCDQERELRCLEHVTDEVVVRQFDNLLHDFELHMNNEAVTVYVPGVVTHWVSVRALRAAGMTILLDDGVKILYVG